MSTSTAFDDKASAAPPRATHQVALRKRMKVSRQKFAGRLGLDSRTVQDW